MAKNIKRHNFMRRVFLALSLLMSFAISVLPYADMAQAMRGKNFIEICSGASVVIIAVDDNNTPVPDNTNKQNHCPFCLVRGLATLDNPRDILIPRPVDVMIRTAQARNRSQHTFSAVFTPYAPRGPPQFEVLLLA